MELFFFAHPYPALFLLELNLGVRDMIPYPFQEIKTFGLFLYTFLIRIAQFLSISIE